ncbi:hypothetical protein [Streptomyces sp. NPDC058424]|uniref:hypothetical protein n=1 Tax=Streptomyces sp. NPDC058424 TaxID=3346491 RepID=UPI0036508710
MTAVPQTAVEPPLPAGTRPVPGYRILGHLARTGRLDLYGSWSEEQACQSRCCAPTSGVRRWRMPPRRSRRAGACRARSPRSSTAV